MREGVLQDSPEGAILRVRVVPRAGRSRIEGVRDDAVRVKLAALPREGAANDALVTLLATAVGIRPGAVQIISGARSRAKRVRLAGVDAAEIARRLRI